ncbi:hypothetical protein PITC_084930 [Penicillium italicum]|uniref:Uncharacterized protein n=1 Tax=Penicillium italicum TaxID=40296 RepID=A0A0A2L517_PENIT|nr:hypothetical protein PITC_084930 [Penicillium italicum]
MGYKDLYTSTPITTHPIRLYMYPGILCSHIHLAHYMYTKFNDLFSLSRPLMRPDEGFFC